MADFFFWGGRSTHVRSGREFIDKLGLGSYRCVRLVYCDSEDAGVCTSHLRKPFRVHTPDLKQRVCLTLQPVSNQSLRLDWIRPEARSPFTPRAQVSTFVQVHAHLWYRVQAPVSPEPAEFKKTYEE
jgi:hypothetical protein